MDEAREAIEEGQRTESQLTEREVPAPVDRTTEAVVLRTLAVSDDTMSAERLYGALDETVRPPVPNLRSWLHDAKTTVVKEVRRGSFELGRNYTVNEPVGQSAP